MATCLRDGCENEVQQALSGRGRPRKYCSDNCVKRASDDRHRAACVDCGTALTAGSSTPSKVIERCVPCHRNRRAAVARRKLEKVAAMYREGMSYKEIAATLGYGPNSIPPEISKAFEAGLLTDADRRYAKERMQRLAESRKAA